MNKNGACPRFRGAVLSCCNFLTPHLTQSGQNSLGEDVDLRFGRHRGQRPRARFVDQDSVIQEVPPDPLDLLLCRGKVALQ